MPLASSGLGRRVVHPGRKVVAMLDRDDNNHFPKDPPSEYGKGAAGWRRHVQRASLGGIPAANAESSSLPALTPVAHCDDDSDDCSTDDQKPAHAQGGGRRALPGRSTGQQYIGGRNDPCCPTPLTVSSTGSSSPQQHQTGHEERHDQRAQTSLTSPDPVSRDGPG